MILRYQIGSNMEVKLNDKYACIDAGLGNYPPVSSFLVFCPPHAKVRESGVVTSVSSLLTLCPQSCYSCFM